MGTIRRITLFFLVWLCIESPAHGIQFFKIQDTQDGDSVLFSTGTLTFPNISGTANNLVFSWPMYDSHVADSAIHFSEGNINHANIMNVGNYSHALLDSHVDDSTIHFTEASIDHSAIVGAGVYSHSEIDSHLNNTSNPHSVTAAQIGAATTTDLTTHTENTSNPHSVTAAQTGALPTGTTTSEISEGTHLYYTEARVSSNTDVAANTTHRAQMDIHRPVFDNVSTATDTLWSSQYIKDYIDATGGSGYTLSVGDGTTTVSPVSSLAFDGTGFTVTDSGSGSVTIANLGGTGGNTSMITEDTTIYVSTTGNDSTGDGTSGSPFASPHKALESIGESLISANATVTIQLADGHYSFTETITPTHPNGDRIEIVGEHAYSVSLSSISSSSGSAGNYSVILNVSDISNIAVNDWIILLNASGGTNPTYLNGFHKVTNVDSGNSRLTVSTTHNNGVPSGTVTGTITVIKSIVEDKISIFQKTIALKHIGIVNTTEAALVAKNMAYLSLDTVGIYGMGGAQGEQGVLTIYGSLLSGLHVAISADSSAFSAVYSYAAQLFLDSYATQGGGIGLFLRTSTAELAYTTAENTVSGAKTKGLWCDLGTQIRITAQITGHEMGIYSASNSTVAANSSTFAGNTTNTSPTNGSEGNSGAFAFY